MRKIKSFIVVFIVFCLNLGQALSIVKKDPKPTSLVFPSFLHTMGIRKATKLHLMIYTRNKVKVKNPQGLVVTRLHSWEDPDDKKDDDEVTGYGVNTGQNLIVYNKSMTALGFYGRNEKGIRKLNGPTGIAANSQGDIYVTDTGNNRIVRLFNPKKELKFVNAIGGKGTQPGQFISPEGIAMDYSGMVYICDKGNDRIQMIRPDNKLHFWFGDKGKDDGQLWQPTATAVTNGRERWTHYKSPFMVVVDLDGTRLQKFDLNGNFIKSANIENTGFADGKFFYLALDYYSNIWVTDFENHCIHKFDRNLEFLTTFGKKGNDDREFIEPRGISIYKRFGQVFIAEKESAQYYWIGTDIKDLKVSLRNENNLIALNFFLTEPSLLTLTVSSKNNNFEKKIFERNKFFSGQQIVYFNADWKHSYKMTPEKNELQFTSGKYKFQLKVEPTYSSINYFAKEVETSLSIN